MEIYRCVELDEVGGIFEDKCMNCGANVNDILFTETHIDLGELAYQMRKGDF